MCVCCRSSNSGAVEDDIGAALAEWLDVDEDVGVICDADATSSK